MKNVKDGYMPFKGYKTYYKVVGEATDKPPLLVLHGGPGSAHNYLLGLSALAEHGRQVIFYDQLGGGGLSDRPKDDSLWTIPLFVEELKQIREHLGLKEVHILGHSWGGMLAIEYLLTKPKGVQSVVLASAMISIPLYQKEVEKLKKDLPETIYMTLKTHEAEGTTESDEYAEAVKVYESRHIYRCKQFPKEFSKPNQTGDSYEIMWGPSEAYAQGSMKDWDRISRLNEISAPTLIIAGQYDELTPEQVLITHDNIPNSEVKIVTAASHCAHVEQPDDYINALSKFLDTVDK